MKADRDILKKYFSGNCSPEELEQLRKCLEDPDWLEAFYPATEWEEIPMQEATDQEQAERFWSVIKDRSIHLNQKRIGFSYRRLAIAAILVALAGIGLIWIHSTVFQAHEATAPPVFTSKETKSGTQPIILENNLDQPIHYMLPDESEISLAPKSIIRFEADYNKEARRIVLEGKALFTVKKDSSKPFIVYCKNFSTTALGTSFTVTGFKEKNTISVRLHTGKVVIKSVDPAKIKMEPVFLSPGESWKLNINTLEYEIKKPGLKDLQQHQQSMHQVQANGTNLYFEKAPLTDVFRILEQYYHVTITSKTEILKQQHFSGSVKLNDPIEKIVSRLCEIHDLKMEVTDYRFTITKN